MYKIFKIILFISIFFPTAFANEETKLPSEHEWNFYSGTFDFSDDGAKSTLFGVQHQNENLTRDSFL